MDKWINPSITKCHCLKMNSDVNVGVDNIQNLNTELFQYNIIKTLPEIENLISSLVNVTSRLPEVY